jgi:hypothetical protein
MRRAISWVNCDPKSKISTSSSAITSPQRSAVSSEHRDHSEDTAKR